MNGLIWSAKSRRRKAKLVPNLRQRLSRRGRRGLREPVKQKTVPMTMRRTVKIRTKRIWMRNQLIRLNPRNRINLNQPRKRISARPNARQRLPNNMEKVRASEKNRRKKGEKGNWRNERQERSKKKILQRKNSECGQSGRYRLINTEYYGIYSAQTRERPFSWPT